MFGKVRLAIRAWRAWRRGEKEARETMTNAEGKQIRTFGETITQTGTGKWTVGGAIVALLGLAVKIYTAKTVTPEDITTLIAIVAFFVALIRAKQNKSGTVPT